jgi:hypothetical protein
LPYHAATAGVLQPGRIVVTLWRWSPTLTSVIAVLAAPGMPGLAHGWIGARGSPEGNGRAY